MAHHERKRTAIYDQTSARHRMATIVVLAFILTLFTELCNREFSVARLFRFIAGAPPVFLCNVMIVLTSLVLSELFLRRRAVLGTVCLLWVVLTANIIALFLGVFLIFVAIIALFSRARRRRRRSLPGTLVALAGCVTLCFMTAAVGMRTGLFPQRFDSLIENYNDYGFPVVFSYTFGQRGIARPNEYSDGIELGRTDAFEVE